MVAWKQYEENQNNRSTLPHQLDKMRQVLIAENRHYVKTIAEILLLCAHQEIALRGHDESSSSLSRGNFLSILQFTGRHDQIVQKRLQEGPSNAKYISPQIQNELLDIMGQLVRKEIGDQVRNAGVYAIMADKSKDISKVEQLSIALRYVIQGNVYERFVTYVHATSLDAASLAKYITDTLTSLNLPLENCVSQCFDGASVMSGQCSGVQARIREVAPKALYIHCTAHRLNLVLVDCVKSVRLAADFFSILETLYVFMSAHKAHEIFVHYQKELKPEIAPQELKRLCDTRWSCRYYAIRAIKSTLASIFATLEDIVGGSDRNKAVEAQGLLLQIQKFTFFLCLLVFDSIFAITAKLSDTLQAPKVNLAAAVQLVTAQISILEDYRSDSQWNKIWDEAKSLAEVHNVQVEISCPRRATRTPARFQDGLVLTTIGSHGLNDMEPKQYYKSQLYYSTLDKMLVEFNTRFSDFNKSIMKAVQAISPNSPNFLHLPTLKPLINHYELDEEDIHPELIQAKRLIQDYNPSSISELIDILLPLKAAFPVLLKLLQIALTLTVTSATCERLFSSLQRTKTYLRSTMDDSRLNNLGILSIERGLSSTLSLDSVLDHFQAVDRNRRITLK